MYRRKGFTSSVFLFSLYAISFSCAFLLLLLGVEKPNYRISSYFSGSLYLFCSCLIYLLPFYCIDDSNIEYIRIPAKKYLRLIIAATTILSLFALIWYIPVAYKMITMPSLEIADTRAMVTLGQHPYIQPSTTNGIAHLGALFYGIQLYFTFILLLMHKRITILSAIVFISSLSYPIFVLAYMGRDGVVFWTFLVISNYLLYGKYLTNTLRRKTKKYGIILISLFGAAFVIISIGRFLLASGQDNDSLLFPFLSYAGQGPKNFAELFDTGIRSGDLHSLFSIIFSETGSTRFESLIQRFGLETYYFYTFVSTPYNALGAIGNLLLAIGFFIIYKHSFRKEKQSKTFSASLSFVYILFFSILSTGIFYYLYYYQIANLWMITVVICAYLFKKVPNITIKLEES